MDNSTDKCDEIQNLISHLEIALKQLKNPNITTISNIIPISNLMFNVEALDKIDNDTHIWPYQFNENFTAQFFNRTKITVNRDMDKIQILFQIPNYRKMSLFTAFPKPFLFNGKPYIYNLGQAHYSTKPNLIIFDNHSYKRNRLYAKNQKTVFCRNFTTIRKCDQAMLLHNNIDIESNCFTKLPLTNFVMQNMFNFYFTIRTPLDVNVTCSNKTEHLYLQKSVNILQIYNCTIRTNNLSLFSNKTNQYKVYALPSKSDHTPHIFLRYFYIFVLLLFFIPNLIFISVMTLTSFFLLSESNNTSTYAAFASTILETM